MPSLDSVLWHSVFAFIRLSLVSSWLCRKAMKGSSPLLLDRTVNLWPVQTNKITIQEIRCKSQHSLAMTHLHNVLVPVPPPLAVETRFPPLPRPRPPPRPLVEDASTREKIEGWPSESRFIHWSTSVGSDTPRVLEMLLQNLKSLKTVPTPVSVSLETIHRPS